MNNPLISLTPKGIEALMQWKASNRSLPMPAAGIFYLLDTEGPLTLTELTADLEDEFSYKDRKTLEQVLKDFEKINAISLLEE